MAYLGNEQEVDDVQKTIELIQEEERRTWIGIDCEMSGRPGMEGLHDNKEYSL
jgi:hypothetical protein